MRKIKTNDNVIVTKGKDAGKTDLGSFGTGSTEVSTYRNSWRQNY